MELVFSIVALAASIIALVAAGLKRKEVIKETKVVEKVDHPFTRDEENDCYRLKGNLLVEGGISFFDGQGE